MNICVCFPVAVFHFSGSGIARWYSNLHRTFWGSISTRAAPFYSPTSNVWGPQVIVCPFDEHHSSRCEGPAYCSLQVSSSLMANGVEHLFMYRGISLQPEELPAIFHTGQVGWHWVSPTFAWNVFITLSSLKAIFLGIELQVGNFSLLALFQVLSYHLSLFLLKSPLPALLQCFCRQCFILF